MQSRKGLQKSEGENFPLPFIGKRHLLTKRRTFPLLNHMRKGVKAKLFRNLLLPVPVLAVFEGCIFLGLPIFSLSADDLIAHGTYLEKNIVKEMNAWQNYKLSTLLPWAKKANFGT